MVSAGPTGHSDNENHSENGRLYQNPEITKKPGNHEETWKSRRNPEITAEILSGKPSAENSQQKVVENYRRKVAADKSHCSFASPLATNEATTALMQSPTMKPIEAMATTGIATPVMADCTMKPGR